MKDRSFRPNGTVNLAGAKADPSIPEWDIAARLSLPIGVIDQPQAEIIGNFAITEETVERKARSSSSRTDYKITHSLLLRFYDLLCRSETSSDDLPIPKWRRTVQIHRRL